MSGFLLVSIFIFSSLSIVTYLYCWLDIRGGRPYILSLRQITSIMDREKLNRMFGQPERGYYYLLSPTLLKAVISKYRLFYYRECLAEMVCIFGAWRFMTMDASPFMLGAFIVLALLCQGVNLVYSIILVRKWGDQMREELENSED